MKILQVHNFYQQRGGEDSVFHSEYELLRRYGDEVTRYTAHNDAVTDMSRVRAAWTTVWNKESYREVQSILTQQAIDIVHVHNTFPLISPSIYYAARAAHVPVVQTLHNYRLLCPGSTLFRDGHLCEDCVGKLPYRGALHGCYRGDRAASAVVAGMLTAHRAIGTWKTKIQTYIALTNFARDLFIRGGLPADRVTVKPNCLPRDPGIGRGAGGFALFAGRLSEEKGVRELLTAWALLPRSYPLKIVGDGALRKLVHETAPTLTDVEYLGPKSHDEVLALIQDASFLVLPSSWYEGLPMTIVEAFACGTPVVTSRLPSMDDLVQHGVNGRRFACGDPAELAREVAVLTSDDDHNGRMRASARATYEQQFTAERNYGMLKSIYSQTIHSSSGVDQNQEPPESLSSQRREDLSNSDLVHIKKS